MMPIVILVGIGIYFFIGSVLHLELVSKIFALIIIAVGSFELIVDTLKAIGRKQFALDYIALLAIAVGVATQSYAVSLVIVLMLSSGTTLEKYGMARAKESLTALTERIPNEVILWKNGDGHKKIRIEETKVGQEIMVRKGEVIPLDGELVTDTAVIDESSLTGEALPVEKAVGDIIRSGTVNMGEVIVVSVTRADKDSTYRKIIEMVQQAEAEKAPLIRLADRYSTIFTIITFILCGIAYALSHEMGRVLAVLVVATPCPLILATPIALFGGVNAAARVHVLIKKLASLEVLSRVDTVIFDKTGTITLGRPLVHDVIIRDTAYTEKKIISIAAALERNSLHPLAKAVVDHAHHTHVPKVRATKIGEIIGQGIMGTIENEVYTLRKMKEHHEGNAIELVKGEHAIAIIEFEDKLKSDAEKIIMMLKEHGLSLNIFTGDKKENATRMVDQLGKAKEWITVYPNCTPEDKKDGVARLKKEKHITAMIGDGINDAPALALSDVGMVFSNGEHTAASEAADIVFLGGDLSIVWKTIMIARRTIRIALESIFVGIGLSIVAMIFAAFGFIPPITGALLQEGIDVMVILNALRASKS